MTVHFGRSKIVINQRFHDLFKLIDPVHGIHYLSPVRASPLTPQARAEIHWAAMTTKETLLQRPDIPDECVQELVERAAILQDRARSDTATATPEEIVRVAEELDIDSEYVEQAIAEWRTNQVEQTTDTAKQRVRQRGRTMMRVVLIGLAIGGLALTAAGVTSFMKYGFAGLASVAAAVVAAILWLLS